MCTIEYTGIDFRISATFGHTDTTHYTGDECSGDYVYIPGGRGDGVRDVSDRFCGKLLQRPGTTTNTAGVVSSKC